MIFSYKDIIFKQKPVLLEIDEIYTHLSTRFWQDILSKLGPPRNNPGMIFVILILFNVLQPPICILTLG